MESKKHLAILKKGVSFWNKWREENPSIQPLLASADFQGADLRRVNFKDAFLGKANLSHADLTGANLIRADLSYANLYNANLFRADLRKASLYKAIVGRTVLEADLRGANLTEADLFEADLRRAKLVNSNLRNADFTGANLSGADLTGADLEGADLSYTDLEGTTLCGANMSKTRIIEAKMNGADLSNSTIFGVSVWGLIGLEGAKQTNLVITRYKEPVITVDNLEVAQFIYLILHSEKIRGVIDTLTSKAVLILGRFAAERKAILDSIREELRKRNYLPILFDFEKPSSRDLTETISTLAHLARFVIADITDPKSVPQELSNIIPFLTSVPVQPILLSTAKEYAMFEHFTRFPWVLNIYRYDNADDLLRSLVVKVIVPAENKAKELQKT